MITKLILGTVQFGLKYGVSNQIGLPNETDVKNILATAYRFGIKKLDTASAYGLAEERIGFFHQNAKVQFDIITKFSKENNLNWKDSLEKSLLLLGVKKVDTIMFHSFESYVNHKEDLANIMTIGKGKLFDKIGVSVYTNEEMEALITDELVSVVQLPFNLLDNHLKRSVVIEKLRKQKKEIHTRSCFLQGLFFLNEDKIPEKLKAVKPFLKKLKQITVDHKIEMGHLALQYALSKNYIDKVLIGVDTVGQLEKNIQWADEAIDSEIFSQIDLIDVTNLALLNPSKW